MLSVSGNRILSLSEKSTLPGLHYNYGEYMGITS